MHLALWYVVIIVIFTLSYSLLDLRSSECDAVSLYVVCCSVNVSVCFVCCMFDSVCELFGEYIIQYMIFVIKKSVDSVYDSEYGSLSEYGGFRELCPVSFLVVGESPSDLL